MGATFRATPLNAMPFALINTVTATAFTTLQKNCLSGPPSLQQKHGLWRTVQRYRNRGNAVEANS